MEKEKINRINQLAKLSKERALTAEEKSEQQELRKEFIKEIRIKRATQLIETGEFNMTQISYMVGINDPRYFSKCFKAQVGMTPTEYKEKVGR